METNIVGHDFLFTFEEFINPYALVEFDMFCRDLGIEDVVTHNASDNAENVNFPLNFIIVYVGTDDVILLETVSAEYNRILTENARIMQLGKRKGHLSIVKGWLLPLNVV